MTERAPRLPPSLLALTPGDLAVGEERAVEGLLARVAVAAECGLAGLLLREPALFDLELLSLGKALREILGPTAWIGVHDRLYLALDPLFDGVHLGYRSLTPQAASAALDRADPTASRPTVGFSAHAGDPTPSRRGADFLLLAPAFRTGSHPDPTGPDHRQPLTPAGLERELRLDPRPTWALGGIDATNAAASLATGVRGIAVRGSILGQEDPEAVARSTTQLLAAVSRS